MADSNGSPCAISCVVVGAGRIGSQIDCNSVGEPLSHIGSILATNGLILSAIVDISLEARELAKKQWKEKTRARLLEEIEEIGVGQADVIALCTPTSSRAEDFRRILLLRPKLLVVEKPFAEDIATAEAQQMAAKELGVELRINFNRRFDTATRDFRARFPGSPAKVLMRYGNGLMNYGSHLVDLMIDWFGPVESVQATGGIIDGVRDPSVDFRCRMRAGFDTIFTAVDGVGYDQFDVDVFFADRRMGYHSGGAARSVSHPVPDLYYRGYAHLPELGQEAWVSQIGGFRELYEGIRDHYAKERPLAGCDGLMAVAVQRVLHSVLLSASDGGRLVSF